MAPNFPGISIKIAEKILYFHEINCGKCRCKCGSKILCFVFSRLPKINFRIFVEHPKIKSHQGVHTNTRKRPCYLSSSGISKNIKFMWVTVIYRQKRSKTSEIAVKNYVFKIKINKLSTPISYGVNRLGLPLPIIQKHLFLRFLGFELACDHMRVIIVTPQ